MSARRILCIAAASRRVGDPPDRGLSRACGLDECDGPRGDGVPLRPVRELRTGLASEHDDAKETLRRNLAGGMGSLLIFRWIQPLIRGSVQARRKRRFGISWNRLMPC
jgi:hypothetical protein